MSHVNLDACGWKDSWPNMKSNTSSSAKWTTNTFICCVTRLQLQLFFIYIINWKSQKSSQTFTKLSFYWCFNSSIVVHKFVLLLSIPKLWKCLSNIMNTLQCMINSCCTNTCTHLLPRDILVKNIYSRNLVFQRVAFYTKQSKVYCKNEY